MSRTQRTRRLRRRQVAARRRLTGTVTAAAVAFSGSLLATGPTAVATPAPATAPATAPAAAPGPGDVVALVRDISPGLNGLRLKQTVATDDLLLFSFYRARRHELWRSDGSQAGTFKLLDLDNGYGPYGDDLLRVGDQVFFAAGDDERGFRLWRTDGTRRGTVPAAAVEFTQMMAPTAAVGDTVFFAAEDKAHGWELWRTDTGPAGAALVRDIRTRPVPGSLQGSFPEDVTALGDEVFFTAVDDRHGRELWRSDGTAGGTTLVTDLTPGEDGSGVEGLSPLGEELLFAADDDGERGQELWATDGTATGTRLVADPRTRPNEYNEYDTPIDVGQITPLAVGEDLLYFQTSDDTHGYELWRSDGTTGGTRMVRDIFPGPESSRPHSAAVLGGVLHVAATDPRHGTELWRSDGTTTGTRLVADLLRGTSSYDAPRSAYPRDLTVLDGTLHFAAATPGGGDAVWASDGTAGGTRIFADVVPPGQEFLVNDPGLTLTGSSWLTAVDGELFFVESDGAYGSELWTTDDAAVRPRLTSARRPQLLGRVAAGRTLTATPGRWAPATGVTYSYQWFYRARELGVRQVPGATTARLRVGSSLVGRRLVARVIATKPGWRSRAAWTVLTAPVRRR
jgi:ELWxxDGT repeat protein